MRRGWLAVVILSSCSLGGCHHARITSVPMSPWNQGTPEGMPFYLPKPLLVIAKNVRHVDEAKIGLTNPVPIPNAFDNQASYGDLKANVTAPGIGEEAAKGLKATTETDGIKLPEKFSPALVAVESHQETMTPSHRIQDGLTPDSFFTYQIVFVPDLAQKYGLRITGKPGEVRAAMNLVNGWMYTGMGPYYLKDSSTAQNRMAFGVATMFTGRGASEVLGEITGIAGLAGGATEERAASVDDQDVIDRLTRLAKALQKEQAVPRQMFHYAEVFIYEPWLTPDGSTDWRLIAHHDFTRDFFLPPADDKVLDQLIPKVLGVPQTPAMGPERKPGESIEGGTLPEKPQEPMPLGPPMNGVPLSSPATSETVPTPQPTKLNISDSSR